MTDAQKADMRQILFDSGATFGDTIAEDELASTVEYVAYNGMIALFADAALSIISMVVGWLMWRFASQFKLKH